MTMRNDLQEAVDYFERVERNNGPDAMVHFGPVARMEMLRQYKLARTALAALRDALKRAEGCEYCAEYPDAYYQSDDKRQFVELCGDTLTVDLFCDAIYIHADFCPWCGRELSGNAEQVEEGV